MSTQSMINKQEALARVEGDVELLGEMIQVFLEEYPKTMTSIKGGLSAKNAAEVELHAHSVKGAMRNFGDSSAVTVAFDLEKIGRSKDLANAQAVFEKLLVEVEKFAAAAKELATELKP